MAVFTIGDTHLSLGSSKPMDIFSGWDNYVCRLEENWRRLISDEDTVVIAGDVSWGISPVSYTHLFSAPLPLGQESVAECVDFKTEDENYDWTAAAQRLSECLPKGIDVLRIEPVRTDSSAIALARYEITYEPDWAQRAARAYSTDVYKRQVSVFPFCLMNRRITSSGAAL